MPHLCITVSVARQTEARMDFERMRILQAVKRQIKQGSSKIVSWSDIFNHGSAMRFQALLEGAEYADQHMKGAFASPSKREVLLHSLEHAPKEGLVLEFGVWSGQTINTIADGVGSSRMVHGFNSSKDFQKIGLACTKRDTFIPEGRFRRCVPTSSYIRVGSIKPYLILLKIRKRKSPFFMWIATCTRQLRLSLTFWGKK